MFFYTPTKEQGQSAMRMHVLERITAERTSFSSTSLRYTRLAERTAIVAAVLITAELIDIVILAAGSRYRCIAVGVVSWRRPISLHLLLLRLLRRGILWLRILGLLDRLLLIVHLGLLNDTLAEGKPKGR